MTFLKKNGIKIIISKSKITKIIKIKKKLIEKFLNEVLSIFWNPLSIWVIHLVGFIKNKIMKNNTIKNIIKKKKDFIFFYLLD